VYLDREHDFSDQEFALAEWLAEQCARALQTLRVQSELRGADRRKTEFLATLSHELRNPLAAIRFALDLLEKHDGREPHAQRVMHRQLQQLVRLVDDLLDAARLTSNKIQIRKARVDLVPIVQHAVDALRPDVEAARHTLVLRLPETPVWVDADEERIDQVVTNLLGNAVRYTPAGGGLEVSVAAAGEEAVLSVADSGIGIEPEDLQRVFEMFTQVGGPGSGGLGIGLALVRGIVELHGGRAEARSAGRGSGSEFRVTLPLASAGADEAAAGAVHAGAGKPYKVLVVDDNADSAAMVGALLEVYGHTVRVAHTGADALAAAADFFPDAALLDIGLPDMNGYELARRLRLEQATCRARLIALTGWGQAADRSQALEAGFDAHLTKPAGAEQILAAIRETERVDQPAGSILSTAPSESSTST
jgi:CheY-like chemotaxis protein/nitrogen-specific signal transduction histidine kinase